MTSTHLQENTENLWDQRCIVFYLRATSFLFLFFVSRNQSINQSISQSIKLYITRVTRTSAKKKKTLIHWWSSSLWCMSSFRFRTIDQPFILPEEYNSVLESWMWLSKFSHSCSRIIFECWTFLQQLPRFFCLFLFDVIRPDFPAQETKTWIESGWRKSCGNMSTAWK